MSEDEREMMEPCIACHGHGEIPSEDGPADEWQECPVCEGRRWE